MKNAYSESGKAERVSSCHDLDLCFELYDLPHQAECDTGLSDLPIQIQETLDRVLINSSPWLINFPSRRSLLLAIRGGALFGYSERSALNRTAEIGHPEDMSGNGTQQGQF